MSVTQTEIGNDEFKAHMPVLESLADKTMDYINELDATDLSSILGISLNMAVKLKQYAYDFPIKTLGLPAIQAFTGEVFRALDIKSLNSENLEEGQKYVRIISSLYGILKFDDIIKPYRLEFNKNCAPDGMNMIKYLKPKVTIEFVKELKASGEREILDLLPGDASKCLDWKLIKAFAKVEKPDFKMVAEGGEFRTPHAGRLKELRGKMLHTILKRKIHSLAQLKTTEFQDFTFSEKGSKPGLPLFVSV